MTHPFVFPGSLAVPAGPRRSARLGFVGQNLVGPRSAGAFVSGKVARGRRAAVHRGQGDWRRRIQREKSQTNNAGRIKKKRVISCTGEVLM